MHVIVIVPTVYIMYILHKQRAVALFPLQENENDTKRLLKKKEKENYNVTF